MTKYVVLLFLGLGLLVSCSDDNTGETGSNVLHYDGDNFTAPTLPSGVYRFGMRVTPIIARNNTDRTISDVSFYLYDVPSEVRLTVSTDNNVNPGFVITSQVLSGLTSNAWNTVSLDQPFTIGEEAFWIDLQVRLPEQMQTIGCDQGPADPNGDWLFDNALLWQTFRERTSDGESVNWNIRAILE